MSKTLEIVQDAVILANRKLAEELNTNPRRAPFAWHKPDGYYGSSVRTQLLRQVTRDSMREHVLGGFSCTRRNGRMIMTWFDNDTIHEKARGPANVEFVLAQLLDIQLPEEE